VNVTIANSVASNNSNAGVLARSAPGQAVTQVIVVHSAIANNGTGIVEDGGGSTTYLAKDTIAGNATAFSVTNNGTLLSFGDNDVKSNGFDGGAISLVSTK
jgi:hypothetical protein